MKQYKNGTKFTICSKDELKKKGWVLSSAYYYHDDFPSNINTLGPPISWPMLAYEGSTFTIKEPYSLCKNWYYVQENHWIWPVATFLEETTKNFTSEWIISNHKCMDGITPIYGWIICKICGKDLREVK